MTEYLPCSHSFPGWDGSLLDAPAVVWALMLSDIGIFAAYIFIAWGLMRYALEKSPFRDITIVFALFIGACGVTHAVKAAVLFVPAFWAEAIVQWVTLLASVGAACIWFFKYRDMVDYSAATDAMRESYRQKQEELLERLAKIEREL